MSSASSSEPLEPEPEPRPEPEPQPARARPRREGSVEEHQQRRKRLETELQRKRAAQAERLSSRRYEKGTAKGQGGDCYMFRLDDDVVLDATTRGNIARCPRPGAEA